MGLPFANVRVSLSIQFSMLFLRHQKPIPVDTKELNTGTERSLSTKHSRVSLGAMQIGACGTLIAGELVITSISPPSNAAYVVFFDVNIDMSPCLSK